MTAETNMTDKRERTMKKHLPAGLQMYSPADETAQQYPPSENTPGKR
jgi:hypothetical protein